MVKATTKRQETMLLHHHKDESKVSTRRHVYVCVYK